MGNNYHSSRMTLKHLDDMLFWISSRIRSMIFGSIYTDQLWVHPDYRKSGLGCKLMEAVHDYGHKCGCTMATVATMSFQGAKAFYEKLGYISDFVRYGYIYSSSCNFMKKEL